MEISDAALVNEIFEPSITHSSPSRYAFDFVPLESEPASGSVSQSP